MELVVDGWMEWLMVGWCWSVELLRAIIINLLLVYLSLFKFRSIIIINNCTNFFLLPSVHSKLIDNKQQR